MAGNLQPLDLEADVTPGEVPHRFLNLVGTRNGIEHPCSHHPDSMIGREGCPECREERRAALREWDRRKAERPADAPPEGRYAPCVLHRASCGQPSLYGVLDRIERRPMSNHDGSGVWWVRTLRSAEAMARILNRRETAGVAS